MVLAICVILAYSLINTQKFLYFDWIKTAWLQYEGGNAIVITPKITEAAYSKFGFYWYYSGHCGEECLDISVTAPGESTRYGSYSYNGVSILKYLGYPMISDLSLDYTLKEDPAYLDRFDTVILLHSEYVTLDLYQAITHHKKVIYLYPNALYAQVTLFDGNITLVRGHGYPDGKENGFDWKDDNTRPDEFDNKCDNWHFRNVSNGYQLNCYPETILTQKPEILAKVKSFLDY